MSYSMRGFGWAGLFLYLLLIPLNLHAKTFLLREIAPISNVKLHSIKDTYSISIPIPNKWNVKEATLKFSYVNSSALLAYKSKLVVSLDDIPLSQATLDPINYENTLTVKIPGKLLASGYHELRFFVAQHSEKECEDPFAPELWTVLKLSEATLDINFEEIPFPLKLSSIPTYIEDPKIFPKKKINIILPTLDKEFLRLASIIAAGIGARLKYRPVSITVSLDLKPGVDNILIGTKEVLKIIDDSWSVPFETCIGINYLPISSNDQQQNPEGKKRDKRFALIAIIGNSIQQIEKAALAFSSISYPFPPNQVAIIKDVQIPKYNSYATKDLLTPGIPVKFKDLGFSTHITKGLNRQPVNIDFYIPPDLYIKPNEYAVLSLHFAHSGAVRKDSTMKITLNDRPVSSIHLTNEDGAVYENYKILIPTYLFKPGKNVLSFQTVLVPLIVRRCEGFQDMNLFLTLFDDSVIRFPSMSHWGKMPAIEHFFDSGFPFSKFGDGRDYAVILTTKDYNYSALALNIFAYLGQLTGAVPTKFLIDFNMAQAKGREIIVIGSIDEVPTELKEKAPIKLSTPEATILYPQLEDLAQEEQRTWYEKLEEKLRGYSKLFPITPKTKMSQVKAKRISLDNDTGLVMEFESPYESGKTVLLWTAKDKKAFLPMSNLLWTGKLRSSARGDLVIFSLTDPEKVYPLKLGPDYYTGSLSKLDKIDFLLRSYTWLFYIILGISIIILAIIIAGYLRRRKRKRLSYED